MKRLIRLACAVVLAVVAMAPTPAAAQACTIAVDPALEFGTLDVLPTPEIAVTAQIVVYCAADIRRVCVGIGAGTGLGSTVADRRMSILGPSLNTVRFELFQDPAFTRPFGNQGDDRATVVFDTGNAGQVETITIYGRLVPGQIDKDVGDYQSLLLVEAVSHNANQPDCDGTGFFEDAETIRAHLRIGPICTIVAAPLRFGYVSELTGTSSATNLAVTCTNGSPYSISLDGGLSTFVASRVMRRTSGLGTISYQLYRDPAHTQVWGDSPGTTVVGTGNGMAQSIPVYGFVQSQSEPQPGSYSDTITATVTY